MSLLSDMTGVMDWRECLPDETINSMIKRDQTKPRRSKDRVKIDFILSFPVSFVSPDFVSNI